MTTPAHEPANSPTADPAHLWIGESFTPHDVWMHGATQVLASAQTAYQQMLVVQSGAYGKGLVLDGKWQTCTGDEFLYHEPLVHTPCVLHGAPRHVLIAGGADGGAAREVLRWKSVERVVLADIDGEVIEACRRHLPEVHQGAFDDPRLEVRVGDAFALIEGTSDTWDVLICDLTDPIEDGPAFPLFTREFFAACQRSLRQGGVFVNQAGSLAPPLCRLLSRVVHTMGQVFAHTGLMQAQVPTYGSAWGLALARDDRPIAAPASDVTDALLRESLVMESDVAGHPEEAGWPLRMFDGVTLTGLLSPPRYIRDQIARETEVYTLAHPPGI